MGEQTIIKSFKTLKADVKPSFMFSLKIAPSTIDNIPVDKIYLENKYKPEPTIET